MIKEATKKDRLLDSLSELTFGNEPPFVQKLRTDAKNALAKLDFPTSKTEYWKYTRIGKIINKTYSIQQEIDNLKFKIKNYLIPELDENIVVLINGFYRADLSKIKTQKEIKISPLKQVIANKDDFIKNHLGGIAKAENGIFIALNTLCFTDGIFIDIDKNAVVEKPIHIINVITNNNLIVNTRTIVKAQDNSSVKIIESFVNLKGEESFTNSVAEFFLNPNAQVEYNKIQNKAGESYQVATEQVYQRKNSNFWSPRWKIIRNSPHSIPVLCVANIARIMHECCQ